MLMSPFSHSVPVPVLEILTSLSHVSGPSIPSVRLPLL